MGRGAGLTAPGTKAAPRVRQHAGAMVTSNGERTGDGMDSNTVYEGAREWAEALAGGLALTALFVGGVALPQLLDALCPAALDALGGLALLALSAGGAAWLLTRR